jgi:hypothetical protein
VDQIVGQHDAHLIAPGLPGAGNLLVFDNQGEAGYPRVSVGVQPRSRVLEIDPVSKQIVWEYTGRFRPAGLGLLQFLHQQRAPSAEWQYADRRRHEWPHFPGHTPRRDRMGIHQPVFAQTPVAGAGKPCAATGCTAPSLCRTTGCPMARHVPSRR